MPEAQGPGGEGPGGAGDRESQGGEHGVHGPGLMGGYSTHEHKRAGPVNEAGGEPPRDPALEHPRCVLQLLKKHFARYTPEMVSEICGCSVEEFTRVAELMCENSGPDRTSAIVYAVGWTQHSTGPQIIRAATILQLLLGNIGRPGGMVMAMRGHCSIQGSTDIPTLYDLLPGYLPQPTADAHHEKLDDYVEYEGMPKGYWVHTKKFIVSLLKAYYGDAAQADNDYRFKWLPRIDGDYSQQPFFTRMSEGEVNGYFIFGQNPAGGAPNTNLHRKGLRELDWLVVADWFETETASFWKNDPKGPKPSEIKTEVFLLPASSIVAKEGSYTNTQRMLQWHDKALDPLGDCRSDLWFVYNLGRRLKELYAGSTKPRDQAIQALTWDYEHDESPILANGERRTTPHEPNAAKVLQEINGYYTNEIDDYPSPFLGGGREGAENAQGPPPTPPSEGRGVGKKPKLLQSFQQLKDDGSTACGGWIYTGVFPSPDHNRARDRKVTGHPLEPEWGFAWPANRRVMYNRASADPEGRPWSERKKLIWWDASQGKWVGDDVPDFEPDKSPDYRPGPDAQGMEAIAGDKPFIMKPDGQAWIFSPALKDGPFPAHYEPIESPFTNLLYPKQNDTPTARYFEGPMNILDHVPSKQHLIVATTFRLTEHYLSGPMSRFNSWLNELQPEMFVELSPELAKEKGIEHGGWLTVRSARGDIEARAMVTRRLKPLRVRGRIVHQIGIPFHWGYAGETVGDVANDLVSMTAEPNVSIQESKAFTVDVQAGRTLASNQEPTKPYAPWPTRDPAVDTPRSGQPEGQMKPPKDKKD